MERLKKTATRRSNTLHIGLKINPFSPVRVNETGLCVKRASPTGLFESTLHRQSLGNIFEAPVRLNFLTRYSVIFFVTMETRLLEIRLL